MRKLLGGATEDLREPPNSFLMRYSRDVVAVKDVRQAVFAGVCLVVDHLGRPNVPPPSRDREQKEKCEDGCYNNRCQDLSSRRVNLDAQVLRYDCVLTSNVKVVRSRSYRTHRA
jgi:hypothetical protein